MGTFKKIRSKTLKNNIFFILGRNLIIRSFEIPHGIWKLHKDFKSVFVFKFRQKTKKFTPKRQKPLFEKRVITDKLLRSSCCAFIERLYFGYKMFRETIKQCQSRGCLYR